MRIYGLKSCLKSIEKFHHLHRSLLKIGWKMKFPFKKGVPPFFGSTFRSFFFFWGVHPGKINTKNLENQPIEIRKIIDSKPPWLCVPAVHLQGYNCNSSIIFAGILSVFLRAEVPFLDLIPAGIAEENMVKVLREKYDRNRQHGAFLVLFLVWKTR